MRLWKEEVGGRKTETRAKYQEAFLAQLGSDPFFAGQGDPLSSPVFREVREFLWHHVDGGRGDWDVFGRDEEED
jgi:hypothetical protein